MQCYNAMEGQIINGWTVQWTDEQTDSLTNGWTNGWTIFLSYEDAQDASENDVFQQIKQFSQKPNQQINSHTSYKVHFALLNVYECLPIS